MVSYPTWVSICRSVAGDKGAVLSDFETNSDVVTAAADVWDRRKAEIKQSSQSQARDIAKAEITVQ